MHPFGGLAVRARLQSRPSQAQSTQCGPNSQPTFAPATTSSKLKRCSRTLLPPDPQGQAPGREGDASVPERKDVELPAEPLSGQQEVRLTSAENVSSTGEHDVPALIAWFPPDDLANLVVILPRRVRLQAVHQYPGAKLKPLRRLPFATLSGLYIRLHIGR